MKVLITGGAGYIGSTTARALELAGHVPVVLDSLVCGPRSFVADRAFYEGDVADRHLVARVLDDHPDIGCTIHMAARIVVPESVEQPYAYYRNNVAGSLELLDQLVSSGQTRVVFSSSASVYAPGPAPEVSEDSPTGPGSPYARSKLMIETVLADLAAATPLRAISLRYFNPVGADPSLTTGPYVRRPTHVLGQLLMAARGEQPTFTLTGTDFPTRDGSGLRDYLHVWDLARAHVRAVERLDAVVGEAGPAVTLNLGTGRGVTVRELVALVEQVTGKPVPVVEGPRRPGDSAGAYANVDRARELLGWHAELSLEDGVRSALAWLDRRADLLGY
ncbi:UDP-glucose 4-epimerase GalE [Microlunatus antarcticus]|uniref:UDP-glucose 4-epimerase n=1 Tax=Microlunatus antarcticus TaxID=53388 RepID=A0A7W5P6Z3_9ACTN|nr:UDP-glucose 4-epimerase [Microlunatus antarcticus]